MNTAFLIQCIVFKVQTRDQAIPSLLQPEKDTMLGDRPSQFERVQSRDSNQLCSPSEFLCH